MSRLRVRLFGGAKAALGSDTLYVEPAPATVGELLGRLERMCAPKDRIDASSVLVAVNGADSSARGGRACPILAGDDVAVITVVHGGSRARVGRTGVLSVCVSGRARLGAQFLDRLRADHPKLRIQAVHSQMVLSGGHLRKILLLALESERRGTMISEKLETEILLRFAVTTQISRAISEAGVRPGRGFVLLALGRARDLDSLSARLEGEGIRDCGYARSAPSFLRRRFGITRRHLGAATSGTPLEDSLAELSAVL